MRPVKHHLLGALFLKSRCPEKQLLAGAAHRAGGLTGSVQASCSDPLTLRSTRTQRADGMSSVCSVNASPEGQLRATQRKRAAGPLEAMRAVLGPSPAPARRSDVRFPALDRVPGRSVGRPFFRHKQHELWGQSE